MKKTFFLLLNLFFGLYLSSQNCVPVVIVFTNQAQVDAFPSQYPGCKRILGNVGITGSVVNLDSLIQIEYIGGSLGISGTSLQSLNGLNNLDSIEGRLTIETTPIQSLTAIQNIINIKQGINFTNNSNLISFPAFQNIEKINGDLTLINLSGTMNNIFPNLDSIDNLFIQLTNVNRGSFPTLSKVKNSLTIYTLNTIPDFNNLISIEQILTIGTSYFLNISGFNNLEKVGSNLQIGQNNYLEQITGFNKLINPTSLTIFNNPFLSSISGFNPNLILSGVNINNNPFLSNCAIQSICQIINSGRNFSIFNNGANCSTIPQIQATCPAPADSDGDGVNNYIDNCPTIPNPNQADA